jgi:hypothetical protein
MFLHVHGVHAHTVHAYAVHVHAAHAHVMHAHIIYGHVMYAHAVHAHAVHSRFYVIINSDMPTAAILPKPVFRGFLVTCRYNYLSWHQTQIFSGMPTAIDTIAICQLPLEY